MSCISELRDMTESYLHEKMGEGLYVLDTAEVGLIVDMIKDYAEALKEDAEAEYYKAVKDAMHDSAENTPKKFYTEPESKMAKSRREYMEHKEMFPDDTNTSAVKKYATDITDDIWEVANMAHMTPQEKQTLKQTLVALANKM